MKLFIDPVDLQKEYAASPRVAEGADGCVWADGLNYYLAKHPEVKPRVIPHFEPWMALSFTEGSIGGDIERVNLGELQEFYGGGGSADASRTLSDDPEPSGSNGIAIAPSNTAVAHALLLINPHTSFFFRSELQMASDEGLNAYGAVDLGPVLHLSGIQRARRLDAHDRAAWTRWTSIWRRSRRSGERMLLQYGSEEQPVTARKLRCPTGRRTGWPRRSSRFTGRITGRSCARRTASGSHPDDAGACEGSEPVVSAHEDAEITQGTGRRWS